MFGILIPHSFPLTQFERINDNKFVIKVPANINNIAVFMTGQSLLNPGFSAGVHFSWPSNDGQQWAYLGCITNEKPCKFFQLSNLSGISSVPPTFAQSSTLSNYMIGISIEREEVLGHQSPVEIERRNPDTTANIARRLAENLYHHILSFGSEQGALITSAGLKRWYDGILMKIKSGSL
ncbi:hypothetical protein ACOME3_000077 [Neoechinorhynchus agilis]